MPSAVQKPWIDSRLTDTGATGYNFPRCFVGTIDPTSDDDETLGFGPCSLWVTVGGSAFICLDSAVASAVWQTLR